MMHLQKISEHVYQLNSWMVFKMNVWFVIEEDGLTLIDTGISSMAKTIQQASQALGVGPIKRILLTHGHSDHVGSIKQINTSRQIPVYAHGIEIPYAEGAQAYPGRKKAQELVIKSTLTPLAVSGTGALEPVGSLQPYHTPGHTPGHTVYYHKEDEVLLCGDLFTEKKGKLNRPMPMFTSDMAQALESGKAVLALNPKMVCMSHGSPVRYK